MESNHVNKLSKSDKDGRSQSQSPSKKVTISEHDNHSSPQRDNSASPSKQRGRSPHKKNGEDRSPSSSASPSRTRSKSPSGKEDRGRSKSPGKFGEKDFEKKKFGDESMKRRQSAVAKVRGLKLDPSQWSRQELMDKLNGFAHFTLDAKSGIGTLVVEGRRLLGDDIMVVLEVMRRVTEIQSVNLSGCGLTDDTFQQIMAGGLAGLRHLKELRLQSNLLGSPTVTGIVKTFSKLSRKLLLLDLQLNSLNFKDGRTLFFAFGSTLNELNGLPLLRVRQEADSLETLDLAGSGMRLAELGMACALLPQLKRLTGLNLSSNRINAQGLVCLVEALAELGHISALDISHNPVTNEEADWSGIDALLRYAKTSIKLQKVNVEGVLRVGSKHEESLSRSLMANRSVAGHNDGYYFNKFAAQLIQRTAKAQRDDHLSEWHGKVKELDLDFIRSNNIPLLSVEVILSNQSGTGRDEIIMSRLAAPSRNIIEF